MRKITYCLILLLFICPMTLMAGKGPNESVLKELDRVIEEKHSFHVEKEKEIDEIKARLHRSKDHGEKYELCGSLFYLYLHYQADSSLYYINEKMHLLPLLDKPELKNEIIINRAEVMGVMGMYNESLEQLRQINPQVLKQGPLNYYYRTFRPIYGGWPTIRPIRRKSKSIWRGLMLIVIPYWQRHIREWTGISCWRRSTW